MASDRELEGASGILGFATLPLILLVAAMIVGVAALLPLVQSSGATTTAGDITSLQQERDDMQAKLEEEQLKVAQLGSLSAVRNLAINKLHMVTPDDIRYIHVDAPPPSADSIPPQLAPETQPQAQTSNSLLDDIIGLIP
ncbi:MAG: hypothetical protein ABI559_01375 [Chloroflexota bacterium]